MPKVRAGGGGFTTPFDIHDPNVVSLPNHHPPWQTCSHNFKCLRRQHSWKVTTPESANCHAYDPRLFTTPGTESGGDEIAFHHPRVNPERTTSGRGHIPAVPHRTESGAV